MHGKTDFSAVMSLQSSLCLSCGRMISAPTAVTEFTGSHNAAPADFPQSYHAIEPVLLSWADDIRPYGGDRIYRFSQRSSGGFFRSHITAIKPVRISRADDIRPYGGDRIHRFSQCGSGGFFRSHVTAIEPVLLSRADDIRPYGGAEFTGSHNAAPADFSAIISPQSYPHNRGLRKICQSKAQGSGREGAYFVYATERTGSCNAAMANFFRSPITPSTTWRWP